MSWLSVLPGPASRALRKLLLSHGRRLDVQRLQAVSRKRAVDASVRAARHSPAYRRLLQEHGIKAGQPVRGIDWHLLPVLTKANTFGRFTLAELARPLAVGEWGDVLTSSGRSGRGFGFRLTSRAQHRDAWFDIDLGLQDTFGVDQKSTLLVNCLPMGVVFQSRAVTVANVSVREDMACSILRDVGPRFDQTLLCTDPMFIRRILDEGRQVGVDWRALNTSVILGEEMLVESQRDYLAAQLQIDIDQDTNRLIGSSFGVGELGLNLLFETRETIRLRRAMRSNAQTRHLVAGSIHQPSLPSVFCYNPLRTHIEILDAAADGYGELCITMLDSQAVIDLPRYATGDWGRLLSQDELQQAARSAGVSVPWLPVVVIQGRMNDRAGDLPSVECIKELLYLDHGIADRLTGAFRLSRRAQGEPLLTVQAHPDLGAQRPDVQHRLHALLLEHGMGSIELELVDAAGFPWRPLLDFERKFAYLDPA